MKNTTFFLIIFSIFFYCSSSSKKLNLKKINTETTLDNTNSFSRIVGEWNISVSGYKGLDAVCNVCPKVNFNVDGSGRITKSTVEELFKWKVDNNVLSILYDKNILNKTFTHDDYTINFEEKNDYVELKLLDKKKEKYFILRREK